MRSCLHSTPPFKHLPMPPYHSSHQQPPTTFPLPEPPFLFNCPLRSFRCITLSSTRTRSKSQPTVIALTLAYCQVVAIPSQSHPLSATDLYQGLLLTLTPTQTLTLPPFRVRGSGLGLEFVTTPALLLTLNLPLSATNLSIQVSVTV